MKPREKSDRNNGNFGRFGNFENFERCSFLFALSSFLIVIPSERSDEGSSAVQKGNKVDSSAIAFGMTKRNGHSQ